MVITGLIGVTVYLVDGDRFNLANSNREVRVEVTSRTSTAASEDSARMFNEGSGVAGNGLDYQGRTDGTFDQSCRKASQRSS